MICSLAGECMRVCTKRSSRFEGMENRCLSYSLRLRVGQASRYTRRQA